MARGIAGAAALTVALAIALTACSEDNQQPTPPFSSPVVSPAETVPSTSLLEPPVRPVDRLTEASAITFIQYFWETYNYAFDTLDSSYLEEASDQTCQFCSGSASSVRELATQNGTVQGGTVKLLTAVVQTPKAPQHGTIRGAIDRSPSTAAAPGSAPVNEAGYKNAPSEYALSWRDGRWHMHGLVVYVERAQPWPK